MAANSTSEGKSTRVFTNQDAPHGRLIDCVRRNYEHAWREPLHAPSTRAFEEVQELLRPGEQHGLILDSGCGTGKSTLTLAGMHPDSVVVGIDRSAVRLRQVSATSLATRRGNCIWVRARLETFWRLIYGAGWGVKKNYLLYPNPWPKSDQLKKRWHAHPVFPVVLAISGEIELRSNWQIYAEEFASAVAWSNGVRPEVEVIDPKVQLSPFELKYANSGHLLYRVNTSMAV